jgi:hypothetical protein
MSDSSGDDITTLLSDLVRTLQDLETEVEPTTESGLPRPPTPSELLRFTSDVTIPAAILILKTNIEALKLLRRALKMADGRPPERSGAAEVRQRATELSRTTLTRLDDALTDLQQAVEGRPEDEEARELLTEAQRLRSDLADRLAEQSVDRNGTAPDSADREPVDVPVDVDAELQSIKADLDEQDGSDGEDGDSPDESDDT